MCAPAAQAFGGYATVLMAAIAGLLVSIGLFLTLGKYPDEEQPEGLANAA